MSINDRYTEDKMTFNHNNQLESHKEELFVVDDKQLDALRSILSTEINHDITLEETKEIGNNLLTLFKALAGDNKVTFGRLKRSIQPREELS